MFACVACLSTVFNQGAPVEQAQILGDKERTMTLLMGLPIRCEAILEVSIPVPAIHPCCFMQSTAVAGDYSSCMWHAGSAGPPWLCCVCYAIIQKQLGTQPHSHRFSAGGGHTGTPSPTCILSMSSPTLSSCLLMRSCSATMDSCLLYTP